MATKQNPVTGDLRKALRQVQLIETKLWDGKLDAAAARKALEQVSKGQFHPAQPRKARRPRKPVYGHFTPVEEYAELIAARRDLRSWPITDTLIEQFAARLVPHAGRLLPTGAKMWLGGDLDYNWNEFRLWALDAAKAAGLVPNDWVKNLSVNFWPGSEFSGKPQLDVCGLDLQTHWDPVRGVVPNKIRKPGELWPGLEVPVFLALNPQYMVQATGEEGGLPFLLAPGLRIESDRLPWFDRNGRNFYAYYFWDVLQFRGTALVAFRELQQH